MKNTVLSIFISAIVLNTNLFAVKVYSITEKGNFRPSQEDVVSIDETQVNQLYCAIFDGHGGDEVSKYLGDSLLKILIEGGFRANLDEQAMRNLISSTFLRTNEEFLRNERYKKAGSTALTAFILNQNKWVVANVGDCRAVFCKAGKAIQITKDHRTSDKDEEKRVENLDGIVFLGRVYGSLAVSRAFGDAEYTGVAGQSCVTPQPDIFIESIKPEDEFLIIASDGLWDTVDNATAVKLVKLCSGQFELACQRLKYAALNSGSLDNVSIIIIDFKG